MDKASPMAVEEGVIDGDRYGGSSVYTQTFADMLKAFSAVDDAISYIISSLDWW